MKEYLCKLSDTRCKYGGNKYYNYEFVQGTSEYCRLVNKWICDLKTCPLENKLILKENER